MENYWPEVITFLLTAASSYGITTQRVRSQQKEIDEMKGQLEEFRKDHDLIIRLDTKVDNINDSIKELKTIIENKRTKK